MAMMGLWNTATAIAVYLSRIIKMMAATAMLRLWLIIFIPGSPQAIICQHKWVGWLQLHLPLLFSLFCCFMSCWIWCDTLCSAQWDILCEESIKCNVSTTKLLNFTTTTISTHPKRRNVWQCSANREGSYYCFCCCHYEILGWLNSEHLNWNGIFTHYMSKGWLQNGWK